MLIDKGHCKIHGHTEFYFCVNKKKTLVTCIRCLRFLNSEFHTELPFVSERAVCSVKSHIAIEAETLTVSVVYFLLAAEVKRVKIGFASNLHQRLINLLCDSPCELTLLGTIPGNTTVEKNVQNHFAHCRFSGEWFDYPSIAEEIGSLIRAASN